MWLLLLTSCFLYKPWPADTDSDIEDIFCDTDATCTCWSIDDDQDGYCVDDPTDPGYDCDDTNPDVHPGADEECNGIDDNCVDGVDEGFPDTDGDGIADCVDED